MVEEKKPLREQFVDIIEYMKTLEPDHYQLDEFRRPLETIAEYLDNSTQSDINEHSKELIAGLAASYLGFVQGQFHWFREANFCAEIDSLNDDLVKLLHSLK